MNSRIKAILEDGTIGKVCKFIVDDRNEFNKESDAIEFIKNKTLDEIANWLKDNCSINTYEREEFIEDLKNIKPIKISELVILLSNLLI